MSTEHHNKEENDNNDQNDNLDEQDTNKEGQRINTDEDNQGIDNMESPTFDEINEAKEEVQKTFSPDKNQTTSSPTKETKEHVEHVEHDDHHTTNNDTNNSNVGNVEHAQNTPKKETKAHDNNEFIVNTESPKKHENVEHKEHEHIGNTNKSPNKGDKVEPSSESKNKSNSPIKEHIDIKDAHEHSTPNKQNIQTEHSEVKIEDNNNQTPNKYQVDSSRENTKENTDCEMDKTTETKSDETKETPKETLNLELEVKNLITKKKVSNAFLTVDPKLDPEKVKESINQAIKGYQDVI